MKLKTSFALVAALLIFVAGCKKDEDSNAIDPSQLTGKQWKTTGKTVSPAIDFDNDGTAETNIFPLLETCEKDNLIHLSTSNVITFDEGATKCDPADNQTTAGVWAWNSDQTKITVTVGGFVSTATVITLNATTFVVQTADTINSTPVTSTETFTAQ
jgi:hypothetical protein